MKGFAPNLTMLFTERPFLERFAAARAAGFHAVEFQLPYGEERGPFGPPRRRRALRSHCSICLRAAGIRASEASRFCRSAARSFAME